MDVVGVVAAVVVGLALLAAGVFKLVDGPAWPAQAAEIGVGRPVALAVPWVEIVVGALLVVQVLLPWVALAAVVLLLAFTALIALRLLQGRHPPCACFGSRSTRPLGAYHVLRAVGLVVLAVLAALWA